MPKSGVLSRFWPTLDSLESAERAMRRARYWATVNTIIFLGIAAIALLSRSTSAKPMPSLDIAFFLIWG